MPITLQKLSYFESKTVQTLFTAYRGHCVSNSMIILLLSQFEQLDYTRLFFIHLLDFDSRILLIWLLLLLRRCHWGNVDLQLFFIDGSDLIGLWHFLNTFFTFTYFLIQDFYSLLQSLGRFMLRSKFFCSFCSQLLNRLLVFFDVWGVLLWTDPSLLQVFQPTAFVVL